MNARKRDEIGLKFVQIDVQRALETQRGGDGRDDLRDQTIQIGVRRTFDVQFSSANLVNGLVIDHESAMRMFQRRVCR